MAYDKQYLIQQRKKKKKKKKKYHKTKPIIWPP